MLWCVCVCVVYVCNVCVCRMRVLQHCYCCIVLNIVYNIIVCRKKDSRVEWLYSGPASTVNREEYLLGKRIDKLVDPTIAEDERVKEV